jgi:hypothetical protein
VFFAIDGAGRRMVPLKGARGTCPRCLSAVHAKCGEEKIHHWAHEKGKNVRQGHLSYLAFDNRNADLLFQVVSRRYERKSLVLTTNLAFKDWASIFPNAVCATALIDRVIHHADVINVEGKSYRLRETEDAAVKKENAKNKPKK